MYFNCKNVISSTKCDLCRRDRSLQPLAATGGLVAGTVVSSARGTRHHHLLHRHTSTAYHSGNMLL